MSAVKRWWCALVVACGLAGGAYAAQPVVGQVVEGSLETERGFSIPLPAARWRVTNVSDVPMTGGSFRVVTLRDVQPQALVPYLFVRHALFTAEWTSPCDMVHASAFDLDRYWTVSSQLLSRCSRRFVTTLPTADRTGWWAGLDKGIEAADAALQSAPMMMSALSVTKYRGTYVAVEAFIRTADSGLSPTALRDATLVDSRHPWNSAIQRWNGHVVYMLEDGVMMKKPVRMDAFEPPPPATVDDPARQPATNDAAAAAASEPTAAKPTNAPVVAERVPVAVPAVAVAAAAPQAAVPVSVPQAAAVAVVGAAAPAVSTDDIARLAAEIARLRDELNARPQAVPVAVAATPAAATAAATIQARRLALVIGNDSYQTVAKLHNARTDAGAMAEALRRTGYKVRLRTDLSERAMKDELRAFKAEIQGGDEVLFYFAGHGVQLAGANYLLPTDIRGEAEDQVRDDALLLQKVLDDLQERKARFALAIVDACRDNPFRTAGRALGGRGLAPTTAATGQMVMFSAGAGQQALDRLGERDNDPNGLFTRILLKEMHKRELSVDRVLRAVRNQVVELARSVGHDQVPALYDQSVGEFYFRR